MKMYLKAGSGVLEPTDIDGNIIKVGDKLSSAYGDWHTWTKEDLSLRMDKAVYEVKQGNGYLFGDGIDMKLYLHDFRFKFARVIV